MTEQVLLLDTTLRDGQLSTDINFCSNERIDIACALEGAGMDVIEVAFPGMHPEDINSSREITKQVSRFVPSRY